MYLHPTPEDDNSAVGHDCANSIDSADTKNMNDSLNGHVEKNETPIIKDANIDDPHPANVPNVDDSSHNELNTNTSNDSTSAVYDGANNIQIEELIEKNNNNIHIKALEAEALIKVFQPDHAEMIENLFKLADRVERWQRWTSVARAIGGWISAIAAAAALGFNDHMNFMLTAEPTANLIRNVGMSTAFIGTLTGAAAYFANRTIKDDGFKELEREIRQDKSFYKQVKVRMESIQEIMEENEHLFSKIYPMVSDVCNLTGRLSSKVVERWETVQSVVKKVQDLLMIDKKTLEDLTKALKAVGGVCCTGIPMASMNTGSTALTVIGIMINIYDATLAFIDYSKNQDARKIRETARVLLKFDRAQEKLKSVKRLRGSSNMGRKYAKGKQINSKAKTVVNRKKSHQKLSANGSSPVKVEKTAHQKNH